MREHGETGKQTYFNAFHHYLQEQGIRSWVITPFNLSSFITFPIFGIRKLIDPLNGHLSIWWYRYWHYQILKQALKKKLNQLDNPNNAIFFAQCPLSAKAALKVRASNKQKVVMAVHFNISQADEWVDKGKISTDSWLYNQIRNIESEVISELDGIIYVSQFMRDTIEGSIPQSRTIPSVVLSPFVKAREYPETRLIRDDLISIGTLEPRKNQTYLLYVLSEAKKQGYRYSLTLVGEGPSREKLEKLAASLDIKDQVIFAGFQPKASRLLPQFRVYAHSALLENRPVAILEAMACSLPILAAGTGGIPECFSDGNEGYYWSLSDPIDGAKKLIQLMESPTIYDSMRQASKDRFKTSFSQEVIASQILNFLVV